MSIGRPRATHESNLRVMAMTVAGELRSGEGRIGINSIFRLHSQWRAHGFYGMIGADRLKELCEAAFGAHDASGDDESWARGARAAAGIRIQGEGPGSRADLVLFWSDMLRLGQALGVDMPPIPDEVPLAA